MGDSLLVSSNRLRSNERRLRYSSKDTCEFSGSSDWAEAVSVVASFVVDEKWGLYLSFWLLHRSIVNVVSLTDARVSCVRVCSLRVHLLCGKLSLRA